MAAAAFTGLDFRPQNGTELYALVSEVIISVGHANSVLALVLETMSPEDDRLRMDAVGAAQELLAQVLKKAGLLEQAVDRRAAR